MNFEEYLKSKKIDGEKFRQKENTIFKEYETLFDKMHPNSFTSQKLFVINKLRRKYFIENLIEEKVVKKPVAAKPKMVMRPKTN